MISISRCQLWVRPPMHKAKLSKPAERAGRAHLHNSTHPCRRCGRHAPASLITCWNPAQTHCLSRVKGSGASRQLHGFAASHRHNCHSFTKPCRGCCRGAPGAGRPPLKPGLNPGLERGGGRVRLAATSQLRNFTSPQLHNSTHPCRRCGRHAPASLKTAGTPLKRAVWAG